MRVISEYRRAQDLLAAGLTEDESKSAYFLAPIMQTNTSRNIKPDPAIKVKSKVTGKLDLS
jgi:hypothetical protein